MRQTTVNTWISDNAAMLRQRLSVYNDLNEDAFQDAYLTLVKEYPAPGSVNILEAAFLKAYRRHSNKSIGEAYTLSHPDELFFTLLPSDETEPMADLETTKDNTSLASRVQHYIRVTFSRKDVMAFELKINGYACRDITDILGIGTTAIKNVTERIISQTRLRFAMAAV